MQRKSAPRGFVAHIPKRNFEGRGSEVTPQNVTRPAPKPPCVTPGGYKPREHRATNLAPCCRETGARARETNAPESTGEPERKKYFREEGKPGT
jgi:hypothetical protein